MEQTTHHLLQQLFVAYELNIDPQAFILSPGKMIRISKELVKGDSYVTNARNGALAAHVRQISKMLRMPVLKPS